MKCTKCGTELREDSMFCSNCGTSLAPEKKSEVSSKKPSAKKYKKSLIMPLVSLIIGAGGWVYTVLYQKPFIMNIYNEIMGNTVSIDDSSLYNTLTDAVDTKVIVIVGALALVFALLAVWGLFSLLIRLWNRFAHND